MSTTLSVPNTLQPAFQMLPSSTAFVNRVAARNFSPRHNARPSLEEDSPPRRRHVDLFPDPALSPPLIAIDIHKPLAQPATPASQVLPLGAYVALPIRDTISPRRSSWWAPDLSPTSPMCNIPLPLSEPDVHYAPPSPPELWNEAAPAPLLGLDFGIDPSYTLRVQPSITEVLHIPRHKVYNASPSYADTAPPVAAPDPLWATSQLKRTTSEAGVYIDPRLVWNNIPVDIQQAVQEQVWDVSDDDEDDDDDDTESLYSDLPITPPAACRVLPTPAIQRRSASVLPPPLPVILPAAAKPGMVIPPSTTTHTATPSLKRKREPSPLEVPAPSTPHASPVPVAATPMQLDDDEDDDAPYAGGDDEEFDEEYEDESTAKRRRVSKLKPVKRRSTKRGDKKTPRAEARLMCTEGCGARFVRSYDRDRHMACKHGVHLPGRESRVDVVNITCGKCGKLFSRADALKRHQSSTVRCRERDD